MAIKVVCGCGARVTAKDDWIGRKARCPACSRTLLIESPVVLESIEESLVDQRRTASEPIGSLSLESRIVLEQTEEPALDSGAAFSDPDLTPKIEPPPLPRRPWWKDPIVVIGATVPSLILLAFFAYLAIPQYRAWERRRTTERVAREQKARVAALEEIKRQKKAREAAEEASRPKEPEPLWLEESEMAAAAKLFSLLNLDVAMRRNKDLDHYKVLSNTVKPLEPDERKIPWLWEATVAVSIVNKRSRESPPATAISFSFTSVFYFPQDAKGTECWREGSEITSGEHFRIHFEKSEWRQEFRDQVIARWLRIFRLRQELSEQRGESEQRVREAVATLKVTCAREFRIKAIELDEILKAAD